MSLHIIVDGYNLIRQSSSLQKLDAMDLQAGREALLELLASYKRMKRHNITVVFDGTSADHLPRRDSYCGIKVLFSPRGKTADQVIQKMVEREREKAVVVSSDREITAWASACGSASIESFEFERKIMMASTLDSSSGDIDSDGWKPTTKKKGPSKRLPRKKRKKLVKIRKL